jgi:hypothetical protein
MDGAACRSRTGIPGSSSTIENFEESPVNYSSLAS